jgi:hypothetical protein
MAEPQTGQGISLTPGSRWVVWVANGAALAAIFPLHLSCSLVALVALLGWLDMVFSPCAYLNSPCYCTSLDCRSGACQVVWRLVAKRDMGVV